jgi:hypothetical protein
MKTLTIDRSKWRTGGDDFIEPQKDLGRTMLLNDKGQMCCLGFYSKQLGGLSDEEILNIDAPSTLAERCGYGRMNGDMLRLVKNDFCGEFKTENTSFAEEAIAINDNERIENDVREIEIIQHFKRIGVDVVFTGEYK